MNFAPRLVGFIKLSKYQYLDLQRMPRSPSRSSPALSPPGKRVCTAEECVRPPRVLVGDSGTSDPLPDKWNKAVGGRQRAEVLSRDVSSAAHSKATHIISGPPFPPL